MRSATLVLSDHLDESLAGLGRLRGELERLDRWAEELALRLPDGARLLAAGNGGSAAHAQHLTAELVGRFRDVRVPYSAIALHADSSTYTALSNDFGHDAVLARQVAAHGRRGDVLVTFSTSGRSPNLLAAAEAARALRVLVLSFTGPSPSPLGEASDDVLAVEAPTTACIQEVHQVALHLLCAAFEARVAVGETTRQIVVGTVS